MSIIPLQWSNQTMPFKVPRTRMRTFPGIYTRYSLHTQNLSVGLRIIFQILYQDYWPGCSRPIKLCQPTNQHFAHLSPLFPINFWFRQAQALNQGFRRTGSSIQGYSWQPDLSPRWQRRSDRSWRRTIRRSLHNDTCCRQAKMDRGEVVGSNDGYF